MKVWLIAKPLGYTRRRSEGKRWRKKYASLDLVHSHWADLGGYREIGDARSYNDLLDDCARHHRIDHRRRRYPHVFAPDKRTVPSCWPHFFHTGRDTGSLHLLQAEDSFSPGQPVLAHRRLASYSDRTVASRAHGATGLACSLPFPQETIGLWLAIIPYVRRINDLGACVHGAHSAKIRSCLGVWYICSAGYFLSFAPGRTLSWKTWPCVSNCWLSMPSDLARDSAQSTNCSGSH